MGSYVRSPSGKIEVFSIFLTKVFKDILIPFSVVIPSVVGLSVLMDASTIPVSAQTALHNVSSQTVQGTSDTGLYKIEISENIPVNLSFVQTGEVVQQIWLSDPSRVNLSFFGCLDSESLSGGSCGGSQGTQILQLRQLREPLDFSGNLVTDGDPTLTLITNGGSAGNSIYQVKLELLGPETPRYATISILPDAPPSPAQYQLVTHDYQQQVLGQLSRGLAEAEAQGLLDVESPAYDSLRSMIALMQSGTTFYDAQNQTNTPRQLINSIRGLGTSN